MVSGLWDGEKPGKVSSEDCNAVNINLTVMNVTPWNFEIYKEKGRKDFSQYFSNDGLKKTEANI